MSKTTRGHGGTPRSSADSENSLEDAPARCQQGPSMKPGCRSRGKEPALTRDHDHIADRTAKEVTDAISIPLRTAYSELLNKPIPEKFVELLQNLAARDKVKAEQETEQDG